MERQVGNRYRLIEPLGEGGMGVVWQAYDELLDRTVAIKEVRYSGVGDAKRAELNSRTIREARAAGRLDHPSVVVIHDVVEEDGRPWIVMQLVKSRSLAEEVRMRGPLPVARAALIGARVLDALRAAHATGVLHRDVKPENVLLADDGRVVLTDFGIASLEAEAGLTATGGLIGTPAYMPPERLNGEPARPESDLWSLGATLYAAVEGDPPFKRDSWPATVAAVLRDRLEPPSRAGALGPVIMAMLHRNPAARMPAEEAAHLLESLAVDPNGTLEVRSVRRRRRRRRWAIVLPAAVALAAVLGTGGVLLAARSSDTLGGASTPGPSGTSAPEPSTPATPSSPSSTPSPSPRPLPDGWRAYKNSPGAFSIALPEGWRAVKSPTRDSVTLSRAGFPGQMIVEWTVPERQWADPERRWEALEKEIQAKGGFTDYTRIGITPLTYLGRPAADWEFTRRRPDGNLIHVVNRGFRTAAGRPFALYWETSDSRWQQDRHYFDTFARTFKVL
ncbi:serine/threonine-protein kinase [Nonomuraea sp. NPDC000554]|uniref:serine/threonine-protein kinase n=1 Tax=Nonomuraea sp. NPDC000554 TaxID=3154259 RepID=UPI003324AC63